MRKRRDKESDAKTANGADRDQSRSGSHSGKSGDGKAIGIYLALFLLAAAIAAVFCFQIYRSPNDEGPQQLPQLPDLSQHSRELKEDLVRISKDAGIPPYSGQEVGRLGKVYHANLFYQEAEICYSIAKRIDKENPRWPYLLAKLYQKKGKHKEAVSLLEQTIDISPEHYPAGLRLADTYFKLGKLRKAERVYRRLVSMPSEGPYAYLGLSRISIMREEWEQAQQYLDKAVEMDQSFGAAHRLLATVHQRFGRMKEMKMAQEAAKTHRFAEAADPWTDDLVYHCYELAELIRHVDIAVKTDKVERALKITERAISLFPESTDVYLRAGRTFQKNRMGLKIALELFERALAMDPENVDALTSAAGCLLLLKQPVKAEAYYQRILTVDPANDVALSNLGYIRYQNGLYNEAFSLLDASLTHNPEHAESVYNMGLVMIGLERIEEAIGHFEEALSINPNFRNAHYNLGYALIRSGKTEEAIAHLIDEIAINPNMTMAHGKLGQAYESQGKLDEALDCYKQVISIDPDDEMGNFFLGRALMKKGEVKEGVFRLQRALGLSQMSGNRALASQINQILRKLAASQN